MRLACLAALVPLVACASRAPSPAAGALVLQQSGDPGLSGELVHAGSTLDRLSNQPADLVVFYGGEEKGSLEPCGCPDQPRGGLARQAAYILAARAAAPDTPTLVVNGGYWLLDARSLDGSPRADTLAHNRWMTTALQQLGVDALNVGIHDLGALSMGERVPDLPLVSAHIEGPGVLPWVRIEQGGLRVGVTGVTTGSTAYHQQPGYDLGHPTRDTRATLERLRPEVDVLILLAFGDAGPARSMAEAGLVDVVIDTNRHRERSPPMRIGDAVWVRSFAGTERLGELRIGLGPDGRRVATAVDRKIELDPEMSDEPDMAALISAARHDIEAAQRAAFGEVIRAGAPAR